MLLKLWHYPETVSVHQSDCPVSKMTIVFSPHGLGIVTIGDKPQLITFTRRVGVIALSVQPLVNDVQKRIKNVTTLMPDNKIITTFDNRR